MCAVMLLAENVTQGIMVYSAFEFPSLTLHIIVYMLIDDL